MPQRFSAQLVGDAEDRWTQDFLRYTPSLCAVRKLDTFKVGVDYVRVDLKADLRWELKKA